jgi:excisionase family DNA binding protein
MMDERAIMTAEEVAAYLRLDQATVYRLANAGEIPARRVGRVWRFHRAALQEWLEAQMRANLERGAATSQTRVSRVVHLSDPLPCGVDSGDGLCGCPRPRLTWSSARDILGSGS